MYSVKISDKSGEKILLVGDSKCLSEEISDDEDSTLSSCSYSNSDSDEAKDKKNAYEELFKKLKENEKNIFSKKSKSSSENSSSTIPQSFKSNKSSKNNLSDCSINEDKFEKNNVEIDNLNSTALDFFLPSVKFQEIVCEDSNDEANETYDKNKKVSFESMFTSAYKKHSLSNEKLTENKKKRNEDPQNQYPNDNILKSEVIPISSKYTHNNINTFKRLINFQRKSKVKDRNCDIASIQTKSETTKKSKKEITNSIIENIKFHSPEMTLYKKLNTIPIKQELKRSGRKDIKQKNTPAINSKQKEKNINKDRKLKTVSEKIAYSKQISNVESNKIRIENSPHISTYSENYNKITNRKKIFENNVALNTQPKQVNGVRRHHIIKRGEEDIKSSYMNHIQNDKRTSVNSKNHITINNYLNKTEKQELLLPNGILRSEKVSKNPLSKREKYSAKEFSSHHSPKNENEEVLNANVKLKNNNPSAAVVELPHVKKEFSKLKTISNQNDDKRNNRSPQTVNNSKSKDNIENVKGKHNLSKETLCTQNITDIKSLTASFPFILGQSTSKTYNVRAAIQQTMSMIMKSPAETLRRSSFSKMFISSKESTQKSCSSYSSSRKVCPACVTRVDENEEDQDDIPIDPWDTEYHSKHFIRCICMPRNTVNL